MTKRERLYHLINKIKKGKVNPGLIVHLLPRRKLIIDYRWPDLLPKVQEEELPVCTWCGGSGQGSHESVQCWKCKGSGVIYPEKEESDP